MNREPFLIDISAAVGLTDATQQLNTILVRVSKKIANEKSELEGEHVYNKNTPEIDNAMEKLGKFFKNIVEEKPVSKPVSWSLGGLLTLAANAFISSRISDERATYDEDYCLERGLIMDLARITPAMEKFQSYVIGDPATQQAYSQLCKEFEAFKLVQDEVHAKYKDMFRSSATQSM